MLDNIRRGRPVDRVTASSVLMAQCFLQWKIHRAWTGALLQARWQQIVHKNSRGAERSVSGQTDRCNSWMGAGRIGCRSAPGRLATRRLWSLQPVRRLPIWARRAGAPHRGDLRCDGRTALRRYRLGERPRVRASGKSDGCCGAISAEERAASLWPRAVTPN